jgi:hypothetical protein
MMLMVAAAVQTAAAKAEACVCCSPATKKWKKICRERPPQTRWKSSLPWTGLPCAKRPHASSSSSSSSSPSLFPSRCCCLAATATAAAAAAGLVIILCLVVVVV